MLLISMTKRKGTTQEQKPLWQPMAEQLTTGLIQSADPDDNKSAEQQQPRKSLHDGVDKKAAKAKVVKGAVMLASGSFLPLCGDRLRNNVKSRVLLWLVYVLGAAVVALIAVLTLYTPPPNVIRASFSVPPPERVALGVQWPTFSVQVRDAHHEPIVGETLYLSVTPANGVPIAVGYPDGTTHLVRTISCLETILFATREDPDMEMASFDQHAHDDLVLCLPHNSERYGAPVNFLRNRIAVTDSHGLAVFQNITLLHAVPNDYLVLIQLMPSGSEMITLRAFLTVTAVVVSINVNMSRMIASYDNFLFTRINHPVNVTMTVVVESEQPLVGLAGQFLTLSLEFDAIADRGAIYVPFPAVGAVDKAIFLRNHFAYSTEFVSVGPKLWSATIQFIDVTITGANTRELYFGVVSGGSAKIVEFIRMEDYAQHPPIVFPPTILVTDVDNVQAYIPHDNVTEGDDLAIDVRVQAQDGTPLPFRFVFARLEPAQDRVVARIGMEFRNAPTYNNRKSLIFSTSVSAANGSAKIKPIISTAGAVGWYWLQVNCDGVDATWNVNGQSLPHREIHIQSRARIAEFSMSTAPWKTDIAETVGEQWARVPSVRVVDAAGSPIPGKIMEVRPRDSSEVAVNFTSLRADDFGWIYLGNIRAVFSKREGTFTFDVLVDEIVGYSFTKKLKWPASIDTKRCAHTEWITSQMRMFTGTPTQTGIRALALNGQVIANAPVIVMLDPAVVPPPPGMPFQFLGPLYTDSNGEVILNSTTGGVSRWVLIPFSSGCLENRTVYAQTPVVVPLVPRVRGITRVWINGTENFTVVIDAYWDNISEANPLTIEAVSISSPSNIALYYPADRYPRVKGTITSPGPVVLSPSKPSPGLFIFLLAADGAFYRIPLGGLETPLGFVPNLYTGSYIVVEALVSDLVIERSCFEGNIEVGVPFAVQPQVSFKRKPLSVVDDPITIFAQIGVESNETDRFGKPIVAWIDFLNVYTTIANGALISFGADYRPISDESFSEVVTFSDLGFLGAIPNVKYRIRFCYAANPVVSVEGSYTDSICVVDPNFIVFNTSQEMRLTLSTYELPATAGVHLSKLDVYLQRADGFVPSRIMFCPSSNISLLQGAQGASFDATGSLYGGYTVGYLFPYFARSSHMSLEYRMMFGSQSPDGVYHVLFHGPGTMARPLVVTVSSTPASIETSGIQENFNVALQTTIGVKVAVLSASGAKLPDKAVEVKPVAVEPCVFEVCGEFSFHSRAFGQTGPSGEVTLAVSFQNANTSAYKLRVKLAPELSAASIRQGIQDDLAQAGMRAGITIAELEKNFGGQTGDLFKVLATILEGQKGGVESALQLSLSDLVSQLSTSLESIDVVQQYLPIKSSLSALTPPIVVHNPVAKIVETQEKHFTLTISRSELEARLGQPMKPFLLTREEAPVLVLLGHKGTPVANASILVRIESPGEDGTAVSPLNVSDKDGVLSLEGTAITVSNPATYTIFVSASGGGHVALNSSFTVEQEPAMTTSDAMQYAAFIVTAVFSPLLLSSVPFSRRVYSYCSALFAVLLASGAIFVAYDVDSNMIPNFLVRLYIYIVVFITMCVSIAAIIVAYFDINSTVGGRYAWRFMNDEGRAFDTFSYARWICNARVALGKGTLAEEPVDKNIIQRGMESIESRATSMKERSLQKLNKALDVELVDLSKGRALKDVSQKALIQPPEIPEPSVLPVSFIVVLSVVVVILIVMTLICINLYYILALKVGELMAYLPSPEDPDVVNRANSLFVAGVTYAVVLIVKVFPQFGFLAALLGPIKDVNLINALNTFRTFVDSVIGKVLLGFIVAVFIADAVVVISCYLMAKRIREITKNVRRGQVAVDGDLTGTEGYIGSHVIHFILLHQIVFWPSLLIVLMLGVGLIRSYLIDQLQVLVIASLSSMIIQYLMEKFIIGWFLTQGYFTSRPEFYSLWHFVDLVLGVFSGFIECIVRWVKGIALFTGLFARLDRNIYPEGFEDSDEAHSQFMCMVVAEAKNSNPIYLCFASWLIVEVKLRRIAAELQTMDGGGNQKPQNDADIPLETVEECDDRDPTSAIVKNISRIAMRTIPRDPACANELELWKPPSTVGIIPIHEYSSQARRGTKERIRQRWWLALMLLMNPSLRAQRKHQIYEDDDDEADDQKSANKQRRDDADDDGSSSNEAQNALAGSEKHPKPRPKKRDSSSNNQNSVNSDSAQNDDSVTRAVNLYEDP